MTTTQTTTLRDAVLEALGGDNDESIDTLRDVALHGADAGFPGFTTHADTCAFYEANRAEILALVGEQASEFGQTKIAFLQGFQCLQGVDVDEIGRALYGSPNEDDVTVPNALAWFALEEVARAEHPNL
jgi:hypothetical protein